MGGNCNNENAFRGLRIKIFRFKIIPQKSYHLWDSPIRVRRMSYVNVRVCSQRVSSGSVGSLSLNDCGTVIPAGYIHCELH